jgi:Peptidase_C39 like family
VFDPGVSRLSRRRFVSLASASAGVALIGSHASAQTFGVTVKVPYLTQGNTGSESGVNCGPATVAMAVNYSGAAAPSVANVRATLGRTGPTDIDQWAWLLDVYRVPWYAVWSQEQIAGSLRKGHPIVIATWMGSYSTAGDYEVAYAQNADWQGRYDSFSEGHAMLLTGISDDGFSYLAHDPNVFPGDATGYYADGTPKGYNRRYSANEVWFTISQYASSMAIAVVPYSQAFAPAQRIQRVKPEDMAGYDGPGGGTDPRRGAATIDPEQDDQTEK